jgi:hypothetical protein
MRLARSISTKAPKNAAALQAYNAKMGKKASRSKVTAEKARAYYDGKGSAPSAKKATASAKPKKPARKKPSIEKRILQTWMRRRDRDTSISNRNWGGGAINRSTSIEKSRARIENQRNRSRQQSQALTNLIAKLSPSGQMKANRLRRKYGI